MYECTCTYINAVLPSFVRVPVCQCWYVGTTFWGFVCGAEYSFELFSLCFFAGLVSALNFNDTSMKIGADVSQLAESQVEESGKSTSSGKMSRGMCQPAAV